MFAPIYKCTVHGETWHSQLVEDIDINNDEIYRYLTCPLCHREVKPVLHNGKQVVHILTEEEMYWENYVPEE
jgi:hypothetical protein